MSGHKDRCFKSSTSATASKRLKGEELVSYIKKNKKQFGENGDALCVATGYGTLSKDGEPVCEFQSFVKALSNSVNIGVLEDQQNESKINKNLI